MATQLERQWFIETRWARISYRLVEMSEVADKRWLMSARAIDNDVDLLGPFGVARVVAIIRVPTAAIAAERLRLNPPVPRRKKKVPRWWMKVLKRQSEDDMSLQDGSSM
jgi:hypothetical protein